MASLLVPFPLLSRSQAIALGTLNKPVSISWDARDELDARAASASHGASRPCHRSSAVLDAWVEAGTDAIIRDVERASSDPRESLMKLWHRILIDSESTPHTVACRAVACSRWRLKTLRAGPKLVPSSAATLSTSLWDHALRLEQTRSP